MRPRALTLFGEHCKKTARLSPGLYRMVEGQTSIFPPLQEQKNAL
ncbi:MAG: hypothetical protein RQM95_04145 [Syntrophaceticus schinkii]